MGYNYRQEKDIYGNRAETSWRADAVLHAIRASHRGVGVKITHKQEAFAQAIASGMTQADAYRAAYSAERMADGAIYREASLLLDNPKVAQRVVELKGQLEKKQLWTREMSVKALAGAYKLAQGTGNARDMIGAVKELNLMHGFNEPTRFDVDHRSSDGSMSPNMYELAIKDLATEEDAGA